MRASQLHKVNTHGKSSDFQYAALLKSVTQHGTDVIPAVVEVRGFGNVGDSIDVVINIGAGDLTPSYTVIGAAEPCETMASGLATQIALETDVDAVAVGCNVHVTKTTAGTVEIVSVAVS